MVFSNKLLLLLLIVFTSWYVHGSSCSTAIFNQDGEKLSEEDIAHIKKYTKVLHENVNLYLRKISAGSERLSDEELTTSQLDVFIANLKSALNKLPPEKGTFYRAVHVKDQSLKDVYIPGSTVEEKSFLSMSDLEFGASPYEHPTHLFRITTEQGKRIEPYAIYPDEKEVLLPPGQTFKVESSVLKWVQHPAWSSVVDSARAKEILAAGIYIQYEGFFKNLEEQDVDQALDKISEGMMPVIHIELLHIK